MMKDLKEYIKEGLFDDLDKREEIGGLNAATEDIKKEIIEWIANNTYGRVYKNKLKFDFNTTPITVDYDWDVQFKKHITSLTNDMFQWGEIGKYFMCNNCPSLKSLKGAPKVVGRDFICTNCSSLESLEGAPKEVGRNFNCQGCVLLKSLEGAPEKVGGDFDCHYCKSLESLEGAPKEVSRGFYCHDCPSLKSLKGASKEVGGCFDCNNCGAQFTEDDVKKVSNVKNIIWC